MAFSSSCVRAVGLRTIGCVATLVAAVAGMIGCNGSSSNDNADQVVVIVSGGNAISAFTTPDLYCQQGTAAGSTDTVLREELLNAGFTVYTSPANAGPGQATSDPGFLGFSDCPVVLPASMTVDATGDIDIAGQHLMNFLNYLNTEYGVTAVNLVGHSMGGLFSRSAIRQLQEQGSPITVRSLTTIGTPWEGAIAGDYAVGSIPLSSCAGNEICEVTFTEFKKLVDAGAIAGREVSAKYLTGPNGWNQRQGNALAGIPVVLLSGDRFMVEGGDPYVWPNDGLVTPPSALAKNVSDTILPHRKCIAYNDTHSLYFSAAAKLDDSTALTADPNAINAVIDAIENADTALETPNRIGCPAP
jgi:triacylglycerol lipase